MINWLCMQSHWLRRLCWNWLRALVSPIRYSMECVGVYCAGVAHLCHLLLRCVAPKRAPGCCCGCEDEDDDNDDCYEIPASHLRYIDEYALHSRPPSVPPPYTVYTVASASSSEIDAMSPRWLPSASVTPRGLRMVREVVQDSDAEENEAHDGHPIYSTCTMYTTLSKFYTHSRTHTHSHPHTNTHFLIGNCFSFYKFSSRLL